MTLHIQQQVLNAVRAALIAASTAAGARVYVDHPDELTAAQLPAIVLVAGDERIERMGDFGFPFTQVRRLDLSLHSVCGGPGAAAAARGLAAQAEAALYANDEVSRLYGLCAQPLDLQGSTSALSGQGSQLVAETCQTWLASYMTTAGQAGSPV